MMVFGSMSEHSIGTPIIFNPLLYRHPDWVPHQTLDMGSGEDLSTFGGRLRAARKARKMSQKALAVAAGVSVIRALDDELGRRVWGD